MTQAYPSIDPADNDSLVGMLRLAMSKSAQNTHVCLPARIVAYDRASNRAQVQPMISVLSTTGGVTPRAQIASVPVLRIGGGAVAISFAIKSGDLGWIIACDRDISSFLNAYNPSAPNTFRTHDFSDSFFIPDFMKDFTVDSEDNDNFVIQNKTAEIKITISDDELLLHNGGSEISVKTDKIEITSPQVIINSDVEINGGLVMTGGVTGDLNVAGAAQVAGNISSGANITASGSITPNVPT